MLQMKSTLIFFLFQCFTFTNLSAQENIKLPPAYQQVLDHHNKIRKLVKAPPLQYSASLSAYAQQWADHLASKGSRIYHSNCVHADGRILGENIYWGSSSEVYSPLDASGGWYEEKQQYRYGPISNASDGTGHYTQMVWKDTREMGLGVAYTKKGGIIVVASYYPAGNVVGQLPY
jgi:pathogenesis-related protein 1